MGRFTTVDVSWLEAAGPLVEWSPRPNAVQISALSDLDIVFPLLDAGLPVSLLGPHTWLAGVSPQQTTRPAAEQALWEGHTVAGNGPWIALDVLGKGPGDTLDVPWFPVSVTCAGPEWMSIQRATLWGPAGEPLAEWQADSQTPPQVTGEAFIPAQQWVIATCEGDATAWPELTSPAWAASSPLFGPL